MTTLSNRLRLLAEFRDLVYGNMESVIDGSEFDNYVLDKIEEMEAWVRQHKLGTEKNDL